MSGDVPAPDAEVRAAMPLAGRWQRSFVRTAWERWKRIARATGIVQTRLLMILLYFGFVFPLGLVLRLTGDPLHLKRRRGSNWTPHEQDESTVDAARRQF
ncbi:MAG: hypothetical protein ACE5I7_13345 [Candidatus Binatia bacterium]